MESDRDSVGHVEQILLKERLRGISLIQILIIFCQKKLKSQIMNK